jgi:hypothetical protein
MTEGVVRTQGTELFVIDTITTSDPTRVKFACPTGITGMGGARDQIETTCLDTIEDKEFAAGLGNPGPVTVPFNLIPREGSHQFLFEWKRRGVIMDWLVALSEGNDVPAVDIDSDGSASFTIPADRTSIGFQAYVSDVNIDVATNEIVRGTMTLQRSGAVAFHAFTPS